MSMIELINRYRTEFEYCEEEYMRAWNSIKVEADASENKKLAARRDAQKLAIDKAFVNSLAQFPELDEEIVWALISAAHKLNLAHLEEFHLDKM